MSSKLQQGETPRRFGLTETKLPRGTACGGGRKIPHDDPAIYAGRLKHRYGEREKKSVRVLSSATVYMYVYMYVYVSIKIVLADTQPESIYVVA